jgi:hypothetical protein
MPARTSERRLDISGSRPGGHGLEHAGQQLGNAAKKACGKWC